MKWWQKWDWAVVAYFVVLCLCALGIRLSR